eukprot:1969396-Pleurochrysis_carterae.AAC.1
MIAAARASACTRGSATTRSASGITEALTPSGPPKLKLVVTLPSSRTCTRCRACMITSRGCKRHGTNGRWGCGRDTHSSAVSAATALAAAAACVTRPGWWNANTV